MQITERPPTPVALPSGQTVHIATQRWALERWDGAADPPELKQIWARKPKFAVNGSRSCAELAILDHLRRDGWNGVWVSAFGAQELRSGWFPAPAFTKIAAAGAPVWAADIFESVRAENHGKLGGFFDVFAWREPGEVRFDEAKVGPDRLRDTQRMFIQRTLRLRPLKEFTIMEVTESLSCNAAPSVGPV
jgi:hypothetical protein